MRIRRRIPLVLALSGLILTLFAVPHAAAALPPTGCTFTAGVPHRNEQGHVEAAVGYGCALVGEGRLTADLWLCYTRPVKRPAGIWYCRIADRHDDMTVQLASGARQVIMSSRPGEEVRGYWCVNASWHYRAANRLRWGTKRSSRCPLLRVTN